MTIKISTGMRKALAGAVASRVEAANGIDFVALGQSVDDPSGGLLTDGFRPGDIITISGTTFNNGFRQVINVAANGTSMVLAGGVVDEAGQSPTITACGKNLKSLLQNGVIAIRSGPAPLSADATETGTLFALITNNAGAFTAGSPVNGLTFDAVHPNCRVYKTVGQTWTGLGLTAGTAGHWRYYDNAYITGASETSIRLQGTIATSGGDLTLSSVAIKFQSAIVIDDAYFEIPIYI